MVPLFIVRINFDFELINFTSSLNIEVISNGDPDNHLDIVQLLIDKGINLNAITDDKTGVDKTALMLGT